MHRSNTARAASKRVTSIAALALAATFGACNDQGDEILGPSSNRVYTQIERLGNPLVSEVFFSKRDHGLHNTKGPDADGASMGAGGTDVPGHIRSFVSQFGRSEKIITTLGSVLSPDMLLVFPNRSTANPATVGWLTWALAPGVGYGGRKLNDDVVDAGLSAVFGNLLDNTQPVLPNLTSDNVPATVRTFSPTFPYLGAPR
ncbi:MAG: DUF4331 family protein [Gemmatimonadaceae bacterium]